MTPVFRKISTVFLLSCAASAFSKSPYGERVLGEWTCQSEVNSAYGKFNIVSSIRLQENNELTSEGVMTLYNSNFNTEMPLYYTAQGTWQFEDVYIRGKVNEGKIYSDNPFFGSFTDVLTQQILLSPHYEARLTRIGSQTMSYMAENRTEVVCLRKHQT